MEGLVVGVKCGMYSVLSDGVLYQTQARGLFRNKNEKVMVGDNVILNDETFIIESIDTRKNRLIRPLISNVDQMMVVLSLVEPDFSYDLAFKFLTYANLNGIPSCLILTKLDRYQDKNKLKEINEVFAKANIPLYFISSKNGNGIKEVTKLFKDKVTCLLGQTGVGKSSLINAIDPNYQRAVGEYSRALGRGKHQTKEVVLLPYMGGYIADTPGFSSLELELEKEDLAKYFPGFMDYALKCFYSNCLHLNEKKCQIKEALDNGEIHPIMYECYTRLINEKRFN